jgi:hypothetical protein
MNDDAVSIEFTVVINLAVGALVSKGKKADVPVQQQLRTGTSIVMKVCV